MKNKTEIRQGWVWPKSDTNCWNYMNRYPDTPKKIAEMVKNKGIMVQAGGNCGFYVKQYAELFKKVYTFEPDPLNFFCLNQNVCSYNVIKLQCCVGNQNNLINVSHNPQNVGKNHVIFDDKKYPTLLIDDLGLDACDLIHLDIEGYEYYAIRGAEKTIELYKPLIVVEVWEQLDDRFEEDINAKLHEFLTARGYQFVTTIDEADKVYRYNT